MYIPVFVGVKGIFFFFIKESAFRDFLYTFYKASTNVIYVILHTHATRPQWSQWFRLFHEEE